MAFSSILRRAASSFAPLAVRALRSQRNFHSAVFTALNQTRIVSSEPRLCPFLPPLRSYSAQRPSSDGENLLDSEIQRAEETYDNDRVEEAQDEFPFKIEDGLGYGPITLSREYQGEEIVVVVRGPRPLTRREAAGRPHLADVVGQPCLDLVVGAVKGNERLIEFRCAVYRKGMFDLHFAVENPEIPWNYIAHEGPFEGPYKGPHFVFLDEKLQNALREYFVIRGFNPSTTNFLLEYMINRERRNSLILKKFVEA